MNEGNVNTCAVVVAGSECDADPAAFLSALAGLSAHGPVDVIVAAAQADPAIAHPWLAAGGRSVLLAWHPALAQPVSGDQVLPLLCEAIARAGADRDQPALFALPACTLGDELGARLAMRLKASVLGRCEDVFLEAGQLVGRRPAFSGRVDVLLAAAHPHAFATVRPAPSSALSARTPRTEGTLRIVQATAALPAPIPIESTEHGAGTPRLEGAPLVVSGGRGMGGPEGFEQLAALASAFGGAVGGSLPAVDAGWVPLACQVGQSGQFVTPRVYVAVGISGTLQHLAGIGPEVKIAAINNDPEAPIFNQAEVGIVGDWRSILPHLVECAASSASSLGDCHEAGAQGER